MQRLVQCEYFVLDLSPQGLEVVVMPPLEKRQRLQVLVVLRAEALQASEQLLVALALLRPCFGSCLNLCRLRHEVEVLGLEAGSVLL